MEKVLAKADKPQDKILLPQENFWESYSPRHEFPLSTVCSLVIHGLVFGGLILGAMVMSFRWHSDTNKPPRMDLVQIELPGGGGTGGSGGFGGGAPGDGSKNMPKENVQNKKVESKIDKTLNNGKLPKDLKKNTPPDPVQIAKKTPNSPEQANEEALFNSIVSAAKEEVERAMNAAQHQTQVNNNPKSGRGGAGGGGSPGSGGGTGGGTGKGIGTGIGDGAGNHPGGKVLIRRSRWVVDFSGDGRLLLKKFQRLNATLAFPTDRYGLFRVVDFSGPTPSFRSEDLSRHSSKVKWFNATPETNLKLKLALNLIAVPKYNVIFLPLDVERHMAQLELGFCNRHGIAEENIDKCFFEIKQRDDGTFGPVVVAIRLKDQNLVRE